MIDPDIRTTDERPVAFHDFRPDQFPFRVRFIDLDTDELVHEIIVRGIGGVEVPGFAPRRVKVEITFANGMQYVEGPEGFESEARQITPPPRF